MPSTLHVFMHANHINTHFFEEPAICFFCIQNTFRHLIDLPQCPTEQCAFRPNHPKDVCRLSFLANVWAAWSESSNRLICFARNANMTWIKKAKSWHSLSLCKSEHFSMLECCGFWPLLKLAFVHRLASLCRKMFEGSNEIRSPGIEPGAIWLLHESAVRCFT